MSRTKHIEIKTEMETRDQITDYERDVPCIVWLSHCDLKIIEGAKSKEQTTVTFLQRLISENLRVIRDRGGI